MRIARVGNVIGKRAGLHFRERCSATPDDVRASEWLYIIALVKQIGAEQSAMGFLEKHTRIPSVRQLRRGIVTKAVFARGKDILWAEYAALAATGKLEEMEAPRWTSKGGNTSIEITLPRQAVSLLRLSW